MTPEQKQKQDERIDKESRKILKKITRAEERVEAMCSLNVYDHWRKSGKQNLRCKEFDNSDELLKARDSLLLRINSLRKKLRVAMNYELEMA